MAGGLLVSDCLEIASAMAFATFGGTLDSQKPSPHFTNGADRAAGKPNVINRACGVVDEWGARIPHESRRDSVDSHFQSIGDRR